MSYYSLPRVLHNIEPDNIDIFYKLKKDINITDKIIDNPIINPSLVQYLNSTKKEIDNHRESWDSIKKLTNPYEYIHTIVPNFHMSISQLKPLSRSFYKLIEIIRTFSLLDISSSIKTFHMAEGPGGFIEATVATRNNPNDTYYGMTLTSDTDSSIPGWKKSTQFLNDNQNVIIEDGIDNNGDLFNIDNYDDLIERHHNMFALITADGGFDFSGDYNSQEVMASKLILVEILYGLSLQKLGGTFILKVYDIYQNYSIDYLFLLASFYENVYIYKPNTSRYANSEKYLVCKNCIRQPDKKTISKFRHIINCINKISDECGNNETIKYSIDRILNIDISLIFISCIENLNSIFGEQQLDNITTTLSLLQHFRGKKERIEQLRKNNLSKCVQWCEVHNIPYNKKINYKNVFLD